MSMGANATLFALPRTDQIRAAVLVQPTSPEVFSRRFSRYLLGPLGNLLNLTMKWVYPALADGLRLGAVDPVFAASAAGQTPVMYVQGENDPVGSLEDVLRMAAATPGAVEPTIVAGTHHFDGFQYLVDQPEEAVAFFARTLVGNGQAQA
jgi:pimeloyl-ACP methyl ester carboxylesterase